MSKLPSWHFRVMDPGEVHVDPVHDEFFKMQDLADALVRESIQNSLDARRSRAPVRVRFRFGVGSNALSAEAAEQYFTGLGEHLEAVATSIHTVLPREDEPVPYLLVEDFGTRGLTGDPHVDPELENDTETKNDFYYFWRNVGRSGKGEVDRGRWGLGKAVFSVASRIHTLFGLTTRTDDPRALLLGQAVLKTHILDGQWIYPYGFFARFERANGLPLPVSDALSLERFADDFGLTRNEPGLSIVIPYFRHDELTFEKLIESSLRQYFYPITRGDLVVEVMDAGRCESITAKTVDNVASRYMAGESGEVARLCALTRWSLTDATDARVTLSEPADGRAPEWGEDLVTPEVLASLRGRFELGDRIAVRATVLVKRKKSKPATSFFDIYLEKDDSLRKGTHHFIRRGITIPDVKSSAPSDKPVRALVVVEQETLSTFLGDAENPAHADWSERADKLRTSYDHHAGTLRFIKNSSAFIAALLTQPPTGRARDFLQEIFSIELVDDQEPLGASAPTPARRQVTGESGEAVGSGEGHPGRMTVFGVAGGFTITGSGDESLLAKPLTAQVAYRVRIGNPFRKHSPFDFNLARGDFSIASEGVRVAHRGVNSIQFIPTAARFHMTVKGFDTRRDLLVRVTELNDAAETELH